METPSARKAERGDDSVIANVQVGAGGPRLILVLALYMVPTIIAWAPKVRNIGSVAVINVLLGWTLVGWVVPLAMAARTVDK